MAEQEQKCPACGKLFVCGMVAGHKRCWCQDLPTVMVVPEDDKVGCYCPDCLQDKIKSAKT